jgi:hypothetical protein
MVRELEVDSRSFQKLLFDGTPVRNPSTTSIRNRRGLIDVLGCKMKYLFGAADERDVKRLMAVCDELHAFESKMVHAADHQLTYSYISKLDAMTRQNAKDIVDLARRLSDSISKFSLLIHRVEADLLDMQAAIEKQFGKWKWPYWNLSLV